MTIPASVRKLQRERGWSDATLLAIVLHVFGRVCHEWSPHDDVEEYVLQGMRHAAEIEDEVKRRIEVKRVAKPTIPAGTWSDLDAFGEGDIPSPRKEK